MSDNDSVEIFIDGACRGNPGPGGWGVLLRYKKLEKRLHGGCSDKTTSNRMYIMAAIKGLAVLKIPSNVIVSMNNSCVITSITNVKKWKEWGYSSDGKTEDGKYEQTNADLLKQLDSEVSKHQVKWRWVKTKGCPDHKELKIADQLANRGIDELKVV